MRRIDFRVPQGGKNSFNFYVASTTCSTASRRWAR